MNKFIYVNSKENKVVNKNSIEAANNNRAHTTATKMLQHTGTDTAEKLNPLITHNLKNKKIYDLVTTLHHPIN